MPSEQASGKPELCSDVYAVGMIGISALTGIMPNQLPEDSHTGEVIWRDRVQVNPKLADILDKMVRYNFSQRYRDAAEALEAWQSLISTIPLPTSPLSAISTQVVSPNNPQSPNNPKSPPWKVLIGSGIGLSIAAVGIFIILNLPEPSQTELSPIQN